MILLCRFTEWPVSRAMACSLCLLWATPRAGATESLDVDAAIVFAVDISSSIDPEHADIQRLGHAEALRSPEVIAAIARGETGCIAITYVEWSVPAWLRTVLPWTKVCDKDDAAAVASEIAANGHSGVERRGRGSTAISYALEASGILLDRLAWRAGKKVIDVSANGTNNDGLAVADARGRVLAKGYVINAIVLDKVEPGVCDDLPSYFRDTVIGGPGAFVMTPSDHGGYAHALRRKLVLEMSNGQDGSVQLAKVSLDLTPVD